NSGEASTTYTVLQRVATPTLSPAGGTYTGAQTVTISDATGGAVIRYTTDGSTPTAASPVYSGPLALTQTTTVRAFAPATGMADSDVAGATYTIKAATPVLSPAGGTYLSSVTVTITDTTQGAAIYYTTDGSTPTSASTRYTSAFAVTQNATVRAIAAASGMTDSDVASAAYAIKVTTPTVSPASGTYTSSVTVTLADTTSGAAIYYTTDGS